MPKRARSMRRRLASFESLEDRRLLATDVQLVADLATGGSRSGRSPHDLVATGNGVFLAGTKATTGEELFFADSTRTRLVKDIRVGTPSSFPRNLVASGTTVFFTANDGIHGRELWKSDGTAEGTVLVKDIGPGIQGAGPSQLTNVNGMLFFVADDGRGVRLWRSDGTAAGTVRVSQQGELPTGLTAVGNKLFFAANDFSGGRALWRSDGSSAGTQLVADFNDGAVNLYQLTNVSGTLFFEARAGAHEGLWKSDGTSGGTVYLRDLDIADRGDPATFTSFGGKLYFSLEASGHDELWVSNGTSAGTQVVKQFPSLPVNLTPVGPTLFFAQGGSLWKTDGTSGGTTKVAGLAPSALANFNGRLVFAGRSATAGTELFTSDGTATGTKLLKNLNPTSTNGIPNSSTPREFVSSQGTLYFAATDAVNGRELWKSDGTTVGTLLHQVDAATAASSPHTLVNLGGELLFAAAGRVWKTSGSGSGATQVPGLTGISNEVAEARGAFFFAAQGPQGRELWKQEAGQITLVKDIYPSAPYSSYNYSSDPTGLTNVGGVLFFAARTADEGTELWRSDGTSAGTVLVKDIAPGKVQYIGVSSSPEELVSFRGRLFFTADTPETGRELWVSDGAAAGTVLFRDLMAGTADSAPSDLLVVDGKLFFTARTAAGRELWVSDGTTAGTRLVKDILPGSGGSAPDKLTAVGGKLFFTANGGQSGFELWKSDGTAAGTTLVRDIRPGERSSLPDHLVNVGGTLYFSANDGATGRELWKSTGTAASTVLVRDLQAGPEGSSPSSLASLGGVLFFSAGNRTSGEELFVSDGTSAGTTLAANIAQTGGSTPRQLTIAGDTLYFSADDGIVGREVFSIVNAAPQISNLGGPVGYSLNSPGVLVASAAQVSDPDNTVFLGGRLALEITSGRGTGNRLELSGAFVVDASNNVFRNGVVIGRRIASGIGLARLEIAFNAQATKTIVEELLRSIRFRTVQGTSTSQRLIAFTLTDGDGGVSNTAAKIVNVS